MATIVSFRRRVWMLWLVFLLGPCVGKANADPLQEGFLAWGASARASQCPSLKSYLWVRDGADEFCIRYFDGGHVENAETVMVQFYGDRDQAIQQPIALIPDNTSEAQRAYAFQQAIKVGIPFVVMARPGTYGSSGDHRLRRQKAEFVALSLALDAFKKRYGTKRFILLGHSGGATVIAGLLTLGRTDIQCAVMSSGTYNYIARDVLWRIDRGRPLNFDSNSRRIFKKYDPMFHASGVETDAARRLYIVGDRRDSNTPFHLQVEFAWILNDYGHHAEVVEMEGRQPEYHNIKGSGLFELASDCANARLMQ